jgi:hypothetical protein
MRKEIAAAIAMTSMLLPVGAALADAGEFRIGPRIGPGELRIGAGQVIDSEIIEDNVEENTLGIGATVEYRAPFGLVLEGGLFRQGTTDWFDSQDYRLSEYFGSVGYQIDLGRGFSITPRVGRARWKLETDDDWFFDDDDDIRPALRGYQNYWEVSAMKRINERLSIGASHRENHYDFGRVRSTVFTLMFDL